MTRKKPYVEPIERAVQHIIHRPKATYASTAKQFGVAATAIRGRIEHRFGSLAEARECNGVAHFPRQTERVSRVCIVCRQPHQIHPSHRICDQCKINISRIHDGPV